jgi:hypothetical protein
MGRGDNEGDRSEVAHAVEMAIENYSDQREPANQDVVIWRFMDMRKFRDLITTSELYFCRADRFTNDEREGLPPEEYLATLGLNPFDINERRQLLNTIGSDAQFREAFYISCWHLFREETIKMWKEYGDQGVAICSRYRLLKSALDAMSDRACIGLVRYGSEHLIGKVWNVFRLITTKRLSYASEEEVRAFLWIMDPFAGINRHIDADNRVHPLPLTPPPERVLKGHKRKVDLQALVTAVVMSPWATPATFEEITHVLADGGYTIPVVPSDLTRYRALLP